MPTQYTSATEEMALQEFLKKINSEEGVSSFSKSETPDGIIHTQKGKVIGVEITSAFRTDDEAKNPDDRNKAAIVHNKYGLANQKPGLDYGWLPKIDLGDGNEEALISKISERIREKEGKNAYAEFKNRFDRSVLIVYLDDTFITASALEKITSQDVFSGFLSNFDDVYLYIRRTTCITAAGLECVGGLYHIGIQRLSNLAMNQASLLEIGTLLGPKPSK